jgi:hypothetical protein
MDSTEPQPAVPGETLGELVRANAVFLILSVIIIVLMVHEVHSQESKKTKPWSENTEKEAERKGV